MHSLRKPRLPNEAADIFEQEVLDGEEHETDDCWGDESKLMEFNHKIHEIKETVYEDTSKKLLKSKIKMKNRFDKRLQPISHTKFELNDLVLVINHVRRKSQLENRWVGPFLVIKINQNTIVVEKDGKPLRFKHSQVIFSGNFSFNKPNLLKLQA